MAVIWPLRVKKVKTGSSLQLSNPRSVDAESTQFNGLFVKKHRTPDSDSVRGGSNPSSSAIEQHSHALMVSAYGNVVIFKHRAKWKSSLWWPVAYTHSKCRCNTAIPRRIIDGFFGARRSGWGICLAPFDWQQIGLPNGPSVAPYHDLPPHGLLRVYRS